jgi:transcriptional regulator with XRE-family HTH domain
MSSSSSLPDEPANTTVSVGKRIRRLRMAHRWSLNQLAWQMRRAAVDLDKTAPSVESLKVMISKWEHDRLAPNEYNRRLLAAALKVSVADLGLTQDADFVW